MKSDRPILKGLVSGGMLFAAACLFALAVTSHHEHYYLKYFRIFLVSFVPAIFASIWAFISRKTWTWVRFLIVTIILFVPCLILIILLANYLPDPPLPLPVITFSPAIPSSWTVEPEPPISDMAKTPFGRQMGLLNKDHKRWIWVAAQNTSEDFDAAVAEWRDMMMGKAIDGRFQIREHEFTVDTVNGRKTAQLYMSGRKDSSHFETVDEAWMQDQFFVMCESMGRDVHVTNDQEIAHIFSSIAVK